MDVDDSEPTARRPEPHDSKEPNDDVENPDLLARWVRHGRHRIVDPEVSTRLDRYLTGRFSYRSRNQWVEIIKSGRIRVDGRTVRPSHPVQLGSVIEYEAEETIEPEVSLDIEILREDDSLLAVDKPPNLPIHPSGRYFRNTLLTHLLEQRGETLDAPGIRVVHRLDRETSGVVVFGKSKESTGALAKQFEARTAKKTYLVLVHGRPPEDRFTVDGSLGPRRGSEIRKAVGVVPSTAGKSAQTEFEVAGRGPEHTLLYARPRTGRLHQIRVHVEHAGYPVVGDKMYGLDERFFLKFSEGTLDEVDRERLLLDRQALHAWKLTLEHPKTGRAITLRAALSRDIIELCERLDVPWAPLAD